MVQFIPPLTEATLKNMATAGERRVAKFLQEYLPDSCIVWCNVPMGKKRLYADFLILFPDKGLLCLEVKDWKLQSVRGMQHLRWELVSEDGQRFLQDHPLEQAKKYAQNITNLLKQDKNLQQQDGLYSGNFVLPYDYAAVFTQISHKDICAAVSDTEKLELLMPRERVFYKEDIDKNQSRASVADKFGRIFKKRFGAPLTARQIDRIRWHLFPELRINVASVQQNLFEPPAGESIQVEQLPSVPLQTPDIIKVMDMQQEIVARSMGGGHRVIHGVAGSGKTLILGMRASYLAENTEKPVLVVCFNIPLAGKIRSMVEAKGLSDKIQVFHYHGWCKHLVEQYGIELLPEERAKQYDCHVFAVERAVGEGRIPCGEYGGVLIDEGHDFLPEWLGLLAKMPDENDDLLLVYDDAQSIYHNGDGLGFTLSGVGIKAQGRSTILRLNYRNTKEIIGLAYHFFEKRKQLQGEGGKSAQLVEPEAAGDSGTSPFIKECASWAEELDYFERCLGKWRQDGIPLNDMAIICHTREQCSDICARLDAAEIPYQGLQNNAAKHDYRPEKDAVTVCTMSISKGLEFRRVMVMGISAMSNAKKTGEFIKQLYVAMTRAQSYLMITLSGSNPVSNHLRSSYQEWNNWKNA